MKIKAQMDNKKLSRTCQVELLYQKTIAYKRGNMQRKSPEKTVWKISPKIQILPQIQKV